MTPDEPGDSAMTELSTTQIRDGWEKTFSTNNPFCPCDLKSFTKAVRWAEHAVAKSAPDSRASIAQPVPVSEPIYQIRFPGVLTPWSDVSLDRYANCLNDKGYGQYWERRIVYAAPPQVVAPVDAASIAPLPVVTADKARELLDALIDIYDDGNNNAPEDRCYVEGAWKETLDEARVYLAANSQDAPMAGGESEELRLDKRAQVGNTRFSVNVKWSTVIGAAQRHYEYMNTPEKEAERLRAGKEFFEEFAARIGDEADAQRYRKLKRCGAIVDWTHTGPWKFDEDIDAAIDAAIRAQQPEQGEGG